SLWKIYCVSILSLHPNDEINRVATFPTSTPTIPAIGIIVDVQGRCILFVEWATTLITNNINSIRIDYLPNERHLSPFIATLPQPKALRVLYYSYTMTVFF